MLVCAGPGGETGRKEYWIRHSCGGDFTMSIKTKIQWCDSTVNPTMGCDGCEIWGAQRKSCYAGTLHVRFGGVTPGYAPRFEEVTLFPGRVAEACGWSDLAGKRRGGKPRVRGEAPGGFGRGLSGS